MTGSAGRPSLRRGRKFDQVLEGARTVFLRDGFEGASVDEIARVAGVSKATLYSYFPDKRLLFMEAAKTECARRVEEAIVPLDTATSAREMLMMAGERIMSFIVSDFGIAMFRIGVAEAQRFPEVGREYHAAGPLLLRARLVRYLQDFVQRGELQIEDYDLAAEQFAGLCKADIQMRLVFGVLRDVPASTRRRVIDGAVDMFLARYGTRDT